MRFSCAAILLAATLAIAACGTSSTDLAERTTIPLTQTMSPRWAATVGTGCSLVLRDQAAQLFGVTWDDVDPLDSGDSEHEESGLTCSWTSFHTPVRHMINETLTGTGGFPERRTAQAEYAKWSAEEANGDLRPVAKLGDADFCEMTPGGQGPRAELIILAGERLLYLNALETADNSCDTLSKFATISLTTMDGR